MSITGSELLAKAKAGRKKEQNGADASAGRQVTGADIMAGARRLKRYDSLDTSGVNADYLSGFVTDAQGFVSELRGDTPITLAHAKERAAELNTRYDTIQAHLYKNKGSMMPEDYESYSKALEGLSELGGIADFYGQFASEEDFSAWLENDRFERETMGLEDFEEFSGIGAGIKNPTYDDAPFWSTPWNQKKFAESIGNMVTFSRDNIDAIKKRIGTANNSADISDVIGDYRYQFMTDNEVAIYNYYLGKGETGKAAEYLASLDDKLNQRWGADIHDAVTGNRFLEMVNAFGSGLDNFAYGIGNLDNWVTGADPDPLSASQYASSMIRNDVIRDDGTGGLAAVGYDLVSTTANMLPSILVSYIPVVGQAAGLVSMGAAATGNAYAEMKRLGYDDWQARGYSLAVGVSEAVLEKVLGGIGKLTGGSSKGAFQAIAGKILPKIDNALARIAIDLGSNMLDEGVEEALQSVLEPIFMEMATAASLGDVEIWDTLANMDWDEVIYSGLLGMLSAGVLEGPSSIANNIAVARYYNRLRKAYGEVYGKGIEEALVNEALELDPNNKMAQKLKKRMGKRWGQKISAQELVELIREYRTVLHKAEGEGVPNIPDPDGKSDVELLQEIAEELKPQENVSLADIINDSAPETATLQTEEPVKTPENATEAATEEVRADEAPTTETAAEESHGAQEAVSEAPTRSNAPFNDSVDSEIVAANGLTVGQVVPRFKAAGEAGWSLTEAWHEAIRSGILFAGVSKEAMDKLVAAYEEGLAVREVKEAKSKGAMPVVQSAENAVDSAEKGREDTGKSQIGGTMSESNGNHDLTVLRSVGCSDDEIRAFLQYKSSEAYRINEKLYTGAELSDSDLQMVRALDRALERFPRYEGVVYRNLIFDGRGDDASDSMMQYVSTHLTDGPIVYKSYTSSSKAEDGYLLNGEYVIRLKINSFSGRDVSDLGIAEEQEILFPRGAVFFVDNVSRDENGHVHITLQEASEYDGVSEEGRSDPDQRGGAVRDLQESSQEVPDLRGVPEGSSQRNSTRSPRSQGALPGGQRDSVRSDRSRASAGGTVQGEADVLTDSPSMQVAAYFLDRFRAGVYPNKKVLEEKCAKAFGGTLAEGAYTPKDAYDALELAVNLYLKELAKDFNTDDPAGAVQALAKLEELVGNLPTQTNRTAEQEKYQQFSTPPTIAYLAAWAANVKASDVVLEPSAGIGGLAVYPKAWGAQVAVNELDERRRSVLSHMGFDLMTGEDARYVQDVPALAGVSPSVVLMNPPFSSNAATGVKGSYVSQEHVEAALEKLTEGGRLVTVLGASRDGEDSGGFTRWMNKLKKDYTVRANVVIDGSRYRKYGTTTNVRIMVIDKVGPQTGETVTGFYKNLNELPEKLKGVRDERIRGDSAFEPLRDRTADERGSVENPRVGIGEQQRDSARADSGMPVGRGDRSRDEGAGGRPALRGTEMASPDPVAGAGDHDGLGGGRGASGMEQHRDRRPSEPVQSVDSDRGRPDGDPLGAVRHDGKQSGVLDGRPAERSVSSDKTSADTAKSGKTRKKLKDTGVYADYVAPSLPVNGLAAHPAVLVESSAMASVEAPKATYKPHLPQETVSRGVWSQEQMVNIVYAGQAHEQFLPNGSRKGYLIGDGTGVGKGRQIAGIILDSREQGRKRAVWVSNNYSLWEDAVRDWTAVGGEKSDVIRYDRSKADKLDKQDGILFTTYSTIGTKPKKGSKDMELNLDKIVKWLGEDFDGVIAFDESHNMANSIPIKGLRGANKPSDKAVLSVELQRRLPKARVVYVSATAATSVRELAYAERLGLWGDGTAFRDQRAFLEAMAPAGTAAMEMVARDMKAMGVYNARSISYDGVEYETLRHNLNRQQREMFDKLGDTWQIVNRNVENAMVVTGAIKDGNARGRYLSGLYGSQQRFYQQILCALSMPSVIEDIRRELDAGHSCVLQIVNTNEAQDKRTKAAAKETDAELEELDFSPRNILIDYLREAFPVTLYEEYVDDDGHKKMREVKDSSGKTMTSQKAVAMRDDLISQIQALSIPDNPLDMLYRAFGVDNVAEITGRSSRVVPLPDEHGEMHLVDQKRGKEANSADVEAFQNGDKRILVFSDAGGTGKSYHADRAAGNQQKRIHYLIQPGWNATKAVQGFGRTHRSNQVSAPTYKLVTTDISGQARFISTIAKRLDNLGAMTKGQRQAGSGFFSAADNLESDLAADVIFNLYRRLDKGFYADFNGRELARKMGLERKLYDQRGVLNLKASEMHDVTNFLNRILPLRYQEQNALFGHFADLLAEFTQNAEEDGTLDRGMENVRADRAELVDEKIIREYENGGEPTKFLRIKTYTKARIEPSVKRIQKTANDFLGIYRDTKGQARAIFALADKTEMNGAVTKRYRVQSPNVGRHGVIDGATLRKYTRVSTDDMQTAWDEAVAAMPEYDVRDTYMVTGALLPIWDRLSDANIKVQRITLDSGERYLGRVINQTQADQLLRQFGQSRKAEKLTGEQIVNAVIGEGRVVVVEKMYSGYELERARVSGENRIEIVGKRRQQAMYDMAGVIEEKIDSEYRYFIPVGEKGAAMLDGLIRDGARVSVKEESGTDGLRARKKPALREERTPKLTDRINPYTNEEAESIRRDSKNRIATTYTDIYEFLYSALDGNEAGRLFIGKLKPDIVAKILSETSVSAYGKSIVLTMDELRHLFKQHGNPEKEAKRGQEAITDENFGEILSAMFEPDSITSSEDESGVVSLVFHKENNGTTTAVTVVSEKKKALTLKSAWRTKKGQHISPPSDVQAPNQTPNSELSMNANPKVSITQTADSVKRESEKKHSDTEKRRVTTTRKTSAEEEPSDKNHEFESFSREDHAGPVTRSELAQFIKERFGIQITFGHMTEKGIEGQYNPKTGGMRARKPGDVETIAHELGHHLVRNFGLNDKLFGSFGDLLRGLVPADVKDSYEQSELPEEGFAEFLTRYLMNRGHAELQFGRDAEGKVSEDSLFYRFEAALDKRTLTDLKEAAIAAEALIEGKNYAEMHIIARDRPYHGHFLLDVAKAYREGVELDGKKRFRSTTEAILDTAAVHMSEGDLQSRHDAALLFRECWVDGAAMIEDICRHAGDGNADAYIHAINASYSTSRAERMLMGDKLTDMEGRIVGEGLSPILEALYDKTKQVKVPLTGKTVTLHGRFLNLARYDRFGEYLVLKHAPERMAEGMTVHADERITPEYCATRCAEIEAEFPEFADMAARLYAYQTNVLKAWAVQTGIVSAEAAEEWAKRWVFYVPFKRDMTDRMKPGSNRVRDTFANQKNPFRRAVGSTRDIIHPIHSIMQTTVQLVMISNKNRVCLSLTEALKGNENSALLMEKIPLHHGRDHVNTEKAKEGVLNDLMTVAATKVGTGKQTAEEAASDVTEIMEIIDSYFENEMNRFYVERTPRTAQEITVLRKGKAELWRVNDPALFREIAGMSKEAMGRTVKLWSRVVRFQTSALTGANLLWSLRSNVARDFQSAMVFLQKNGKGIKGIAGAFRDLVKGYIASLQYLSAERMGRAPKVWKDGFNADFEEFLALGAAGGSVWAGDKALSRNALKRMGNKAWSDKFNILGWINTLSTAIELGPRYAEYHLSKQLGATSAVAFYRSMDLTTNFSKGGRLAREINKFIPFFNASIQGINRFVRYYIAADVGVDGKFVHGEARRKLIRQRVTGLVMASVIGAALSQLLRLSDKEDYDRLSNYTKLNYWCIPVPFDGLGLSEHEFITISKPRELAVLESTLSFFADYVFGKDWADGDLGDWWEYFSGTVAPPIIGDLLQIPSDGIEESGFNILGSIGVVGPLIEVFANRNFLGQPIIPTYLEDVLPEDQYKQDTSLVAYWLGQAFGLSPAKLDHLAEGILGGYWEWHKTLFPKGGWDYADPSMGFRSNLIRNSAYSTDVANRLYDGREAAMLAYNSDPEDPDKKITYKWYDTAASFYSRYGKLAKATEDGKQAEDDRLRALEHVESFLSVMESGGKVAGQDELEAYVRATGDTSVMPGVMQTFIKYGENGAFDRELSLNAGEYIEFQGKYNDLFWKYAAKALAGNLTEEQRGEALQVARDQALIEAKNYILGLHGYSSKRYRQTTGYDDVKSAGVSLTDYAKVKQFWREAESDKDRNGQTVSGSKRDKVAEYIDSLRISDRKKDALYLAMGYSESTLKYAPWH